MLTQPELTIVIPAKNEARNLPRLLISLSRQDYPLLPHTRVYVADAVSTDGTVDLAAMFADRLRISVIAGGLPAVGRNRGARLATTPYVLFVDADIEFNDDSLLRRSLDAMKRRKGSRHGRNRSPPACSCCSTGPGSSSLAASMSAPSMPKITC
jgi:glycosyltransferase involved in cell wall biosynthesis